MNHTSPPTFNSDSIYITTRVLSDACTVYFHTGSYCLTLFTDLNQIILVVQLARCVGVHIVFACDTLYHVNPMGPLLHTLFLNNIRCRDDSSILLTLKCSYRCAFEQLSGSKILFKCKQIQQVRRRTFLMKLLFIILRVDTNNIEHIFNGEDECEFICDHQLIQFSSTQT